MTIKHLTGAYPGGYTLSAAYTGLVIEQTASVGGHGVLVGFKATVTNLGMVNDTYTGIALKAGGSVTNGSAADTGAMIAGGYYGVDAASASAKVTNFGTISASQSVGAAVRDDGRLINGSAADTGALITGGHFGVDAEGASATVANFGTIKGAAGGGVYVFANATVINGAAGDTTALIAGAEGVSAQGSPGATVTNFGAITGVNGGGVVLGGGGKVTNGSATDKTALISGTGGSGPGAGVGVLAHNGSAVIANFGTILGTTGSGVYLLGGGTVTNGSARDHTALISGATGVTDDGPAAMTVTNFGTIQGAGGVAVLFKSSSDELVVEANSAFLGSVNGGGGVLELANGTGTLIGLFAGGSVRVSGSMAPTTFGNFGTVEIGARGTFSTAGAVAIAAGQSVIDAGSLTFAGVKNAVASAGLIETSGPSAVLTIQGALANTGTLAESGGTLTVAGAVTGTGAATIKGGTLDFAAAFTQNVTFTGLTGVLELGQSQGYAGSITGFSHSGGTSLDLADIGFVSSTEATFKGTKTGGVLTVTDGTHTAHINLEGNFTGATFVASSDGHGGTLIVDPPAGAARTPHGFIAAMAKMGADGAGSSSHAPPGEVWRAGSPALARPKTQAA